MRKKVCITGSSGSLGKILVNSFDEKGIPVVGIDIRDFCQEKKYNSFNYFHCSITDRDSLLDLFAKEQPTHVFHLACSYNTIRNKKHEYENDVRGSENVIDATINTPSVKQLIYFSSAAAYGPLRDKNKWLTEKDPIRPGKYRYGINKKSIEERIIGTNKRPDLQKVILRLCTTVGPSYDKDASVVSILIKFPYMLRICQKNILQFLHEDDLINIISQIIEDAQINGVYNIAPDSAVVVKDLVPEKKYVHVPYWILKIIFTFLWNFKIMNLQPAALSYSVRPVCIDPSKITQRYKYRFRYTSQQAFEETRETNMLDPARKY